MRDVIVLGERCNDIADEMLALDVSFRPDKSAQFSGTLPTDGPLLRAIFRAEAELLLADADAMATGRFAWRTPDQRRADAFVLLAERIREALRGMTEESTTGHDSRRTSMTEQRRRLS